MKKNFGFIDWISARFMHCISGVPLVSEKVYQKQTGIKEFDIRNVSPRPASGNLQSRRTVRVGNP